MFVCQWHLRDVFYLGNVGTFDISANIIFCSIETRRLTKGVCEGSVVVFSSRLHRGRSGRLRTWSPEAEVEIIVIVAS